MFRHKSGSKSTAIVHSFSLNECALYCTEESTRVRLVVGEGGLGFRLDLNEILMRNWKKRDLGDMNCKDRRTR